MAKFDADAEKDVKPIVTSIPTVKLKYRRRAHHVCSNCGEHPAHHIEHYENRRLSRTEEADIAFPEVPKEETAIFTVGVGVCRWCKGYTTTERPRPGLPEESWQETAMRELREKNPDVFWDKPEHWTAEMHVEHHREMAKKSAQGMFGQLPYDKDQSLSGDALAGNRVLLGDDDEPEEEWTPGG